MLQPPCQRKMPGFIGFSEGRDGRAEKSAGADAAQAAISTAP
jgi:hypothetical protein